MVTTSALSHIAHCLAVSAAQHQYTIAAASHADASSLTVLADLPPAVDAYSAKAAGTKRLAEEPTQLQGVLPAFVSPPPAKKVKHSGTQVTGSADRLPPPTIPLYVAVTADGVLPGKATSAPVKTHAPLEVATSSPPALHQAHDVLVNAPVRISVLDTDDHGDDDDTRWRIDTVMLHTPSKLEEDLLEVYMADGYKSINHALRSQHDLDGLYHTDDDDGWQDDNARVPLRSIRVALEALVYASRVTTPMRLFRGVPASSLAHIELRAGTLVSDLAFVSTSRSMMTAKLFSGDMQERKKGDDGSQRRVIFEIFVQPGYCALDASAIHNGFFDNDEKEVVLPPNTTLQIRSVAQDEELAWVKADVVAQQR